LGSAPSTTTPRLPLARNPRQLLPVIPLHFCSDNNSTFVPSPTPGSNSLDDAFSRRMSEDMA
jgi:hypothetical protein